MIPKVKKPNPWPKANLGDKFMREVAPLLFWKPTVEIKGKYYGKPSKLPK